MKRMKIVAIWSAIILLALIPLTYMWFHGYFDQGKFEIKQAQWVTPQSKWPSSQSALINNPWAASHILS